WPASTAEADALWERRLKFEIVNEMLGELPNDKEPETITENTAVTFETTIEGEPALPEELKSEVEVTNKDDSTEKVAIETKASDGTSPETETVNVEETTTEFDYDKALAEAKENVGKRYERLGKWVDEIEPTEVQEIFLTALTHQYDPHSTYMSADTLEEFAIAMRNSLVGIGALLGDIDGYCTIRELLPGGPAERSRELDPEDQIVGVAQGEDGEMVDVIGMKLNKVVKMIRGKKGTIVRLLIKPAGGDPSERRVVSLVRDEIQLTAKLARAEIFEVPHGDKTIPIGVIELPAFYGSGESTDNHSSTTEDVEELIGKLKDAGVEGIVLDLRGNGGGLLSEAINLTGLFIPVGPVVQVKDYIGHVQEYLDQDPKVAWDGPLLVLVSRYSASASEIAAGALKNHGRALIVGDMETHGKGTVQAVFEMARSNFLSMIKPRSGAAKVTIQKYYLPDGTSTQLKGVTSDIILPSLNAYLPIGEGELHNALAWDSINSLEWNYDLSPTQKNSLIDTALIDNLRSLSETRQGSLEEFSYLKENIDWFRDRQEQKEFSLNFDFRRSKRENDLIYRDEMEDRLEVLSEKNFDSREILLSVAEEQKAEHDSIVAEREAAKAALETTVSDEPGAIAETTISEEVSVEKDGDKVAISEEMDEEEEEIPLFDIQLREGLRIMADWISLKSESTETKAATVSAVAVPGQS
ncbi:MAG: carboxy terminal-processing peptidase, partial [Puniceicoccales bacterium]